MLLSEGRKLNFPKCYDTVVVQVNALVFIQDIG